MPIPVNNTGGSYSLDKKLAAAGFYTVTKAADALLSQDGNTEVVVEIGRQNTSTMIVHFEPSTELAAMPANRNGLLPRTDLVAGGSAEVALKDDEYFKFGIDSLGVKPGEVSSTAGKVGGKALIKSANAAWVETLATEGEQVEIEVEGGALTADEFWDALVDGLTAFTDGDVDVAEVVTYVSAGAWGSLIKGKAVLNTAVDPREQAKTLLGINKLRVLRLPAGVQAIQFHPKAAAQGIVMDALETGREDFDDIVEGRVKHGAAVLVDTACRVIVAVDEIAG